MKKTKEKFDIDYFIKEGYLLIEQTDLSKLDPKEVKNYQKNIGIYRRTLKKFFNLTIEKKKLIEALYGVHAKTKCHYAGFWEKSSYDSKEGIDFCLEFFNSRDYHQSNSNNMCIPEEASREIAIDLKTYLPSGAAYEITKFIHKNFVVPILAGFTTKHSLPIPNPTLQIQCTHYPEESTLSIHQDKGFFEGIIGPAKGFIIQPGGRDKKVYLDLEIGEAILYTGLQFFDFYKDTAPTIPFPLLHGIQAEAGRMSIPFACLYNK